MAATILALASGSVAVSIVSGIDHTEEVCPFCNLLGMEHQAKVINNIDGSVRLVYKRQ